MMGIDNQRVADRTGVNPVELKEVFHAIVLDIESEAHAGNEDFAVSTGDFSDALDAVAEIPIAETPAVAADHTIRAKRNLDAILSEMTNEAYADVLYTDVYQSLDALENCFVQQTNYQGEDSIAAK